MANEHCDPTILWRDHQIRWCDNGKKGPGWYKLKQTGRASFYVKLTEKLCPLCFCRLNAGNWELRNGYVHHPRPDEWLAAERAHDRKDEQLAGEALRLLVQPEEEPS